MPANAIDLHLTFAADEAGNCTRVGAQAKYDALLAAIAAARPFADWPTAHEDGAVTLKHLCRHPEGQSCPLPSEVGVRPPKRIVVSIEAIPEELP